MDIRLATGNDFNKVWPVFQEIASAGDTYAYPTDISKKEAEVQWMQLPEQTYLAEENNEVVGTYYLKPNHAGPGNHVCNCGYMVPSHARGRGIATTMCNHSQEVALDLGYKAMQFNFVASTNKSAVRLWKKLGFRIVGRLPGAFNHPEKGYVDAFVMYKWLVQE